MFRRLRELKERRLKQRTLRRWRSDPRVAPRIDAVLELRPESLGIQGGPEEERSLPGNAEFIQSGWSEHMLLRYLLTLDRANGRDVLDSCSGLGWGSHLVASVAKRVVGVDLSASAVEIAKRQWGAANLEFRVGSVLELPFESESFDVVLCMEAIEHFSIDDGRRYLGELARVCKPGGTLFGSSAFPEARSDADTLCAKNEYHLHIYTRTEMRALLQGAFGRVERLSQHYFEATKPQSRAT